MSRLSTAVVVDDDARNSKAVAFGFEREGLGVKLVKAGAEAAQKVAAAKADLLVVGMEGAALSELIKTIRSRPDEQAKLPILVVGAKGQRTTALQAGASEFVARPLFVKDIVHVAKLVCMVKPSGTAWAGDVNEFPGMFFLLRAISSTSRSGVITFVRGLRRGEVRFYEGEVTSAQANTLHGIAALHQLLLWTEGRFELRAEDVVRRQQIPLTPQELFEDAQRFLNDFEEVAKDLTPAAVYEQDLRRVAECVDKIPKEVNPVMRLFDGSRTVADVVEDSPFRVVETVKIATRLIELGALRKISAPRPRGGAHEALAVSRDWVIGTPPSPPVQVSVREIPIAPSADLRTPAKLPTAKVEPPKAAEPVAAKPAPKIEPPKPAEPPKPVEAPKPNGAHVAEAPKPAPVTPPAATGDGLGVAPSDDWTIPTPLASAADLAAFAPVVPSHTASGEIKLTPDELAAIQATAPPAPPPVSDVAEKLASPDAAPLEQVLAAMAGLAPRPNGETQAAPPPPAPVPVSADATPAAVSPPVELVEPIYPEPDPARVAAAAAKPYVPAAEPAPAPAPPPVQTRPATHPPGTGDVAHNVKQFSKLEEEFFKEEHKYANAKAAPVESFDDLDEGIEVPPPNFWKRLFGAKPPPGKGPKAAGAPTRAASSTRPAQPGHQQPGQQHPQRRPHKKKRK